MLETSASKTKIKYFVFVFSIANKLLESSKFKNLFAMA